jgi:hypothetical protein
MAILVKTLTMNTKPQLGNRFWAGKNIEPNLNIESR